MATVWTKGHFFVPSAKLTKAALMRNLQGGGKRTKGKAPQLWLFYMADSAPHPHQIRAGLRIIPNVPHGDRQPHLFQGGHHPAAIPTKI